MLLRRIDAVEPDVQAWVAVDRAGALETAAALDAEAGRGRLRGPLHGVPVGLKDIFHGRRVSDWSASRSGSGRRRRFDALLMPAASGPAPDRTSTGDPIFNAPWSGIGAPSIALPTALGADGLPRGTQLVGAPFAEARLLPAARHVLPNCLSPVRPPGSRSSRGRPSWR